MPVTVAPSPGRGATVAPPPAIRKRSGGQVETGFSGLVLEMTGCNALHVCRSARMLSEVMPAARGRGSGWSIVSTTQQDRALRAAANVCLHDRMCTKLAIQITSRVWPDIAPGQLRPVRARRSSTLPAAIRRYGCTAHARHLLLARASNSAPAASCLNKASNSNDDNKN